MLSETMRRLDARFPVHKIDPSESTRQECKWRAMAEIDPWYLANLVCPLSKEPLTQRGSFLVSPAGMHYPIVDGVPVMLHDHMVPTIGAEKRSLEIARTVAQGGARPDSLYSETLGVTAAEQQAVLRAAEEDQDQDQDQDQDYDPVVAALVGASSGIAYGHLRLKRHPYLIPTFRFATGGLGRLLDIGCNWGRWTIAAGRLGHEAIGIDPQLGAVLAARRVAKQLGVSAMFVVGDGRYLPFADGSIDYGWSYSVLQHLSPNDARLVLGEAGRVLKVNGQLRFQMANALGIRSFYHLMRRGFREPQNFEVRYWTPRELKKTFEELVGPVALEPDCFMGLGLQWCDYAVMTPAGKLALITSEFLRRLSLAVPPLSFMADSLFCTATCRSFLQKPNCKVKTRDSGGGGPPNGSGPKWPARWQAPGGGGGI
jgi:SAM-dependent methyltransferase/uncharacterized protein YbaR (Trm112 family)